MTDSATTTESIWGGAWGRTRTESLHTTCVCGEAYVAEMHRSLNTTQDSALAERLRDGSLADVACPACGAAGRVDISILVHDEERRRVALVIPDGMRHRELEERAEVLLALAKDREFPLPRYARDFAVLFGAVGFEAWLTARRPAAGKRNGAGEDTLARREDELTRREADLRALADELEEKRRRGPTDGGTDAGQHSGPDIDPAKITLEHASSQALLDMLEDKDHRLPAALELCERSEPLAIEPVFASLRRMTRGEAVRALPAVVKLGDGVAPHLIEGLRSRKAYLRQGCALALGVLHNSDGVEPLCELLLSEPTEVWREVARAIGELGEEAVTVLAGRLRGLDPDMRERVAWAMAHVAARSGATPVEDLVAGRDLQASGVARRALELAASARDSNIEVRGQQAPHDQTVNRAFSRRFFEAVAAGLPAEELERIARETDTGTVQLDDSELMEADDDDLQALEDMPDDIVEDEDLR